MNNSHQALMPPRLVKVPWCKSGMARSASLACAEAAIRSSAANAPRIVFRLGRRGRRDAYGVNMSGEVSLEGFPISVERTPARVGTGAACLPEHHKDRGRRRGSLRKGENLSSAATGRYHDDLSGSSGQG